LAHNCVGKAFEILQNFSNNATQAYMSKQQTEELDLIHFPQVVYEVVEGASP